MEKPENHMFQHPVVPEENGEEPKLQKWREAVSLNERLDACASDLCGCLYLIRMVKSEQRQGISPTCSVLKERAFSHLI